MKKATAFATVAGIHVDWSYSQHSYYGLQLYFGGYGVAYADGISTIAHVCANTSFGFSEDAIERFEGFLLKGVQWASWGKLLDYNALGRGTTFKKTSEVVRGYLPKIEKVIEMNTPGKEELKSWAKRIDNDEPGGPQSPIGNRMFWRHDFMVHRTSNWYASVRATSKRTVGNESGQGNGLRNFHMADGVFMHMRTGQEYEDLFPVWDWHKIPGITAELHGDYFPSVDWGKGAKGGSDFAGGVSDSKYGIMSMQHNKAWVSAKKAWFMTPDGIVALGSSINTTASNTIFTTIEQNNLWGSVSLSNGGDYFEGDTTLPGLDRVFHNGSLYESLDSNSRLKLSVKTQTGSWRNITSHLSADKISKRSIYTGY